MAARSGGRVAADVGVTSPDAAGAGEDCTEAMFQRKLVKYGPVLNELRSQGLSYVPLVWSSWGRPHAEASACIEWASKRAARLRSLPGHAVLRSRWEAVIGTEIWRRVAAMLRACMPLPDRVSTLIAEGEA